MANSIAKLIYAKPAIAVLILLLLLMYFPLFGHLGNLTIRIWDESRVTVNAYEMWRSGDLLVTKYLGKPDLWNTKPPLLIWIQLFFLNFIDNLELAMRLPSALAGIATILLVYFFVIKQTKSVVTGFIAALVLLSSRGYINIHGTRTGDYDALLVFFTTLSCLMFWLFIEKKRTGYLYLFFISLTLGVLTKSISALMFLPALLIYAHYRKKFTELLINKHFYFGSAIFIGTVGGYYLLRELAAPGYLKAVSENELMGRYLNVIEFHNEPFRFYYDQLLKYRYKDYFLLLLPGALAGLFLLKNQRIKKLTIFIILLIVSYFMVISLGKTKLFWYDLPMYPFFAILVSFVFSYLLQIRNQLPLTHIYRKTGSIIILLSIVVFLTDMMIIITKQSYKPPDDYWEKAKYTLPYYLRDAINGKHDLKNINVIYDGYNAMIWPYIYKLQDNGINISLKELTQLNTDDQVICYQPMLIESLNKKFDVVILGQSDKIITYKLLKRK
jgi:4-amino-4-deoxy-L-arabinose transferase-like glycosyltransferase